MVAILICPLSLRGAEFWPLDPGPVYHYETESGDRLDVTYFGDFRQTAHVPESWNYANDHCSVDVNGDVLLNEYSYSVFPMPVPDIWLFETPVKFLDLPLEVGKSWSTVTSRPGVSEDPLVFDYEVLSEETVTVPYGTFTVYVLSETSPIGSRNGTYFLDRCLGPIVLPGGYQLVKIDQVVNEVENSWGSVKALFR